MSQIESNGVRTTPVLEVRGVYKRFGAVTALDGVNLSLYRGEILALLGDNGAGKSTLIKCITGVHKTDGGQILLNGERISLENPTHARAHGIEVVYQDLALFDNLDVVTNLYVGHELNRPRWLRALGWLDRKAMTLDAQQRLERLQINLPDFKTLIGLMSGGQRQAIAVARAVAFAKEVLILDEPTAALGLREAKNVLDTVRRLPEHGISVILITHNMKHVLQLCDNAVVMRQGRVVGSEKPNQQTMQQIVSMIIGASTTVLGAI